MESMNHSIIRYILCRVIELTGILLLFPCIVAVIYREKQGFVFLIMAVCCLAVGNIGKRCRPKSTVFYAREGFVTVSLSWIIISLIGALPFFLTGEIASYVDALFETISGLTTTGGTILSDVEALSYTTQFWRCFTHWIGGMGVLVLILAILPLSGSYNMHLMRAESPGPSVGKLVPKVRETALLLYKIYMVITIAEMVALCFAGLPLYDAAALSFSTVGTGGFALVDSSIASYNYAVQLIIIVFMLICAINFNTYYLLLHRKWKDALIRNSEAKWFLGLVFLSAAVITFNIRDRFSGIFQAFHAALFQVATLVSSTGFATEDFNLWPELSRTILVLLMFMGACAGSTGGGFKVSRLLIVVKSLKNELLSMTHPRSVNKVYMDGRRVPDLVVKTALCYMTAYVLIVLTSVLLISVDNFDMTTNLTAVLATLDNIGPGLNTVGPTGNFGGYSTFSKIVLMGDMLIGRLEIFPVLVIFAPGMWKIPAHRRMGYKEMAKLDQAEE